jgi:hypothetical protein
MPLDTHFQLRHPYPLAAIPNQFTSLYRYGAARECSGKWEDLKFCLSNRSLSEEQKTEEWIRRRAEHWAERRMAASSEDVWDAKQLHDPAEQQQQQSS